MRIWLIQTGEPLPTDGKNFRLLRTGNIADALVDMNHEVLWWASSVAHLDKSVRTDKDTTLIVRDNYRIRLIHAVPYRKNISIMRLINHQQVSRKFARMALDESRPDIILCSYPTPHLSRAAVMFGERFQIPVVLDVRDWWPDIFLEIGPGWLKIPGKILLTPLTRMASLAFAKATAIIGITPAFVEWGLRYGKRKRSDDDRDFPLGYTKSPPSQEELFEGRSFWKKIGLEKEKNKFIVCFFGKIGSTFEGERIIEAARLLQTEHPRIRFVLCGSGDRLSYYQKLAESLDNIILPGVVGRKEIWTLSEMSSVGLIPVQNRMDYQASLPNKVFEYLSFGLPIFSSLKGAISELITTRHIGEVFEDGSDLASKLVEFQNAPDQQQKMARRAVELYQEKYVAETIYKDMSAYLVDLCNHFKATKNKVVDSKKITTI